jgi:beta-phosphoglucomutase
MDGVLVDSYRAHLQSWQDTAKQFNVAMSEADFASTFGRTSREIIATLWHDRIDGNQIPEFDASKERRYREILEQDFPEMPGASELIRNLHNAGFKLAIGSSGPPENVALVRQRLPNGGLFAATVDGSEVRRGKPHPDVFLLAAEKLRLDPSKCVVIEDAPAGLEAAKRAGMIAIALTGTAGREALEKDSDIIVESLQRVSPSLIATMVTRASSPL